MKKKWMLSLMAMAGIVGLALPVGATTIYDNGVPNTTEPGWISNDWPQLYVADDFTLAPGHSVISDLHWWGSYYLQSNNVEGTPFDDDFVLRIYASDSGGAIGTELFEVTSLTVQRNLTGLSHSEGWDVYEYSAVLDDVIALNANTTYWISIANSATAGNFWTWANSNGNGNTVYTANGGINWTLTGREMAFSLTDDFVDPVPEPATLSLLGMGLIGLAARARRKQH